MIKTKKVIAVIQARMNSERLPGKVLLPLNNKSILSWVIDRAKITKYIDEIWVATSDKSEDDAIEEEALNANVYVFRGSEENVFDRYYQNSIQSNADIIIRMTADNPFTYYKFIDDAVGNLAKNDYDYVSYIDVPLGSGVEVFNKATLLKVGDNDLEDIEKEHVTLFIKRNKDCFKLANLQAEQTLRRPEIRLTVDTEKDYMLAKAIMFFLGDQSRCLHKIIRLIEAQPWLAYINIDVVQQNL